MPQARTRRSFPLIALNLAIVLLVGGGTAAYGAMSSSVTLKIEGETDTIRTFGSSVSDVLAARDIEVRPADKVSLDPTHQLSDGDDLTVAYAKPVTLSLNGAISKHTVYDQTLDDAFEDIGVDVPADAYMSVDPDTALSRASNVVVVSTNKNLTITADGEKKTIATTEPTVSGALEQAGITLDDDDEVEPGISAYLKPGQDIRVVRIETKTRTETVDVDFDTETKDDPDALQGEIDVVTEGEKGENRQQVELTYADGKLRDRTVLSTDVVKAPVTQVETRGTSTTPPDSVWDKIAQCESGGNWSINTGNGYYGGLQFSAATWRSVGGPGLPHENSREVQIKYAEILQARAGWGQWGCADARFN